jgi:zinc protease
MRTALLACGLALAALSGGGALAAPPAASPASKTSLFPYPLKVDRLKNGLTVVRIPFDSPGLVAYYTAVRVGSRNEVEKSKTGFAHFFEHIMFKGTEKYPEGARDKLVTTAGYNDNAFTSDDVTVYNAFGPADFLPKMVELEADRFQNLKYSEQTFQTEAKAVLGEYHKNAANPALKIEETLLDTAFTQHTYRHTTLGFYEDIQKMPEQYKYSLEFFKRWYTPDNSIVVIVGDFNDTELMALIRKHYGSWKSQAPRIRIPTEPAQTSSRKAFVEWPHPTLPRLVLAWHTPAASLKNLNTAVEALLGAYLAGPTSPLYKELVLDKQLVESIDAGELPHRDPYLFPVYATLKDEKHRGAVTSAIEAAVKELASGKIDRERFATLQSNQRYALSMALDTAPQVATLVSVYAGVFGEPDALGKHAMNITRVKPEDLVTFAKKHLTDNNRTTLDFTSKATSADAAGGK